jgi:hypothetical protein
MKKPMAVSRRNRYTLRGRFRRRMNRFEGLATVVLLVILLIAMSGCSSLRFTNPEARNAEIAWQAIHVLDTLQTVSIANSPDCLYERNPWAAKVYGSRNPSPARVVATNLVGATLHWTVGSWLDRATERAFGVESGNRGLLFVGRLSYNGMSIIASSTAVVGNARRGVKMAAGNLCPERKP